MSADPPKLVHLARRLVASLRAVGSTGADDSFARSWLNDAEFALWQRQRPVDRRHSAGVARHVAGDAEGAPRWVMAAALLHDVGKVTADLGVAGRVLAAVLKLAGMRRAPGALGRYLRYPEAGAELLSEAGSDAFVVAWSAQHHLPPASWTVPPPWAEVLARADDKAV